MKVKLFTAALLTSLVMPSVQASEESSTMPLFAQAKAFCKKMVEETMESVNKFSEESYAQSMALLREAEEIKIKALEESEAIKEQALAMRMEAMAILEQAHETNRKAQIRFAEAQELYKSLASSASSDSSE